MSMRKQINERETLRDFRRSVRMLFALTYTVDDLLAEMREVAIERARERALILKQIGLTEFDALHDQVARIDAFLDPQPGKYLSTLKFMTATKQLVDEARRDPVDPELSELSVIALAVRGFVDQIDAEARP